MFLKKKTKNPKSHGASTATTIDICADCRFCKRDLNILIQHSLYIKYSAS